MPEGSTPKFIREFSKERSADERRAKAAEVRSKRSEYFEQKKGLSGQKENTAGELEGIEKEITEKVAALEALRNRIETLSESTLGKVANYFAIRKLKADALLGESSYKDLLARRKTAVAAKDAAVQNFDERFPAGQTPEALMEARKLVKDFYEGEKGRWASSDHTKEDMERYFSEERLAFLSLEEYALLLRRFPGQMVAHVTRQGIRDHIGNSMMHSLGRGAYADGFMEILKSGSLRSPLGIALAEKENQEAIAKYLLLDMQPDKETALTSLEIGTSATSQGEAGSYADRSAVHTATEMVADAFYGSEHGNEIFFAFPSAQIASQYFFQSPTLAEANEDSMRNDQWIWANEQRGIPINTGLVFIPEDTMVGADTGSRYQLDADKNPVVNQEYLDAVVRIANAPNFPEFAKRFNDATSVFNPNKDPELKELHRALEQEYGISDPALQNFILDYGTMSTLALRRRQKDAGVKVDQHQTIEREASGLLYDNRLLFLPVQDGIHAKDFWENYFLQHPEQKPSKIVYYKEEDPTLALRNWRVRNGVEKRSSEGDIGFPEHIIEATDPVATRGIDRFKDIATEVIEEYYADKAAV